jgi:hypothetical protein
LVVIIKLKGNFMVVEWSQWITAAATMAVPIVLAIVGSSINKTIAEKDRSLKYIELAAEMLKAETNLNVRDWAVDVINNYSEIKMSGAVKQAISGRANIVERGSDTASMDGRIGR